MKNLYNSIALIISLILLQGCFFEVDDVEVAPIMPAISVPLGSISMSGESISNIGDSLKVQTGKDNIIELYYETDLFQGDLEGRLEISNNSFSSPDIPFDFSSETNKTTITAFPSFKVINQKDTSNVSAEADSIHLKTGSFNMSLNKNFDHTTNTTVSFPTIRKNGVPLTVNLLNSQAKIIDLSDYWVDLTGINGTEVNTIDYEVTVTVTKDGVSSNGTAKLQLTMTSMSFNSIFGDFGTYIYDVAESSSNLSLGSAGLPDNIKFTNPRVEIVVDNSAGIDFGLDVQDVNVTLSDGTNLAITGQYKTDVEFMPGPMVPGGSEVKEFVIDTTNTNNFVYALNELPESASLKAVVKANPNGTRSQRNFVTDSSTVDIKGKFVLPLQGWAQDYALIDTMMVNLEIDSMKEMTLNEVSLRLKIENSFPFEMDIQLYFLDSARNYDIIDSLFSSIEESRLLPSPVVVNGLVQTPYVEMKDVSVANEKYERIRDCNAIRIVATFRTTEANVPKEVKITTDNYFNLSMGLSATLLTDPSIFIR